MLKHSLLRKFTAVKLTEVESTLFSSLLEASEAMGKGTVLRAAGGWVRDKLLGIESHDVDIALDNVPGDEFALFLYDREKQKGSISSIGVVKENPNQSKHMRTATFRFHGFDVDVNNLRSETYADDSRIPEVEFAKHPSEDALRRDFTINALYYNLNTEQVEDFTGSGLEDLEKRLIRTPLPAAKTFVDDPLRVLRAIRFAARFGFTLDQEIQQAWTSEDVKLGLVNKVSRERVGVEISKMMKGRNPLLALELLYKSGLLHLILEAPTTFDAPSLAGVSRKDYEEWKKALPELKYNDSSRYIDQLKNMDLTSLSDQHTFLLGMSSLFMPTLIGQERANPSLIARLSMKLSSGDSKSIGSILQSLPFIQEALSGLRSGSKSHDEIAILIGRQIRGSLKDLFPVALRLALAADYDSDTEDLSRISELVTEYSLAECYTWRPVIDGSELATILSLKPGPILQKLIQVEFDIMFRKERDRDTILQAVRDSLE